MRPGPPARIEVDLTYFLTEQGKTKAEEEDVKIQTDVFVAKPPTPTYIPKKTGIDQITQIEDTDLFDYDIEVVPILNVLLSKTVEQAMLEVEEEAELTEIHKFKSDYAKRRANEHDDWQQEVKKEVARIKQKNKALSNARARREQQIKTMHKLQCLNISKNYLQKSFEGSLQYLVDNSYWRNSFHDQLHVIYKEWLLKKMGEKSSMEYTADKFLDTLCEGQVSELGAQKIPIKKAVQFNLAKKDKVRQIESKKQRNIHYLFNPNVPMKISAFSRKYQKLRDGTLEEFEAEEKEKFEAYI